jgi:hypothetical protein
MLQSHDRTANSVLISRIPRPRRARPAARLSGTAALLLTIGSLASAQSFGPRQQISAAARYPQDLSLCDLDGDGDQDILCAQWPDNQISWFSNSGSGSFGAEQVISQGHNGPRAVHAADLDGDGDLDVIASSVGDDKVFWHENLGGASFGPEQLISSQQDFVLYLLAADLDGDGDLDVVSLNVNSGGIMAWHENLGGGGFAPDQVLYTGAGYGLAAADFDGDGDTDLASGSGNRVAWRENQGGGVFGAAQPLPGTVGNLYDVGAADLDGDGDMDVMSASGFDGKGAWYENLGGGSFGPQQVLCTLDNALRIRAGDLDGDGDLDVVVCSGYRHALAWVENLGGGSFGAQQSIFSSSTDTGVDAELADIDGDADLDIVTGSYYFIGTSGVGRLASFRNLMGPFVAPGSAFCFGDGTGGACPCLQSGNPGQGCANSGGGGAVLTGSGVASISSDSFRLAVTGVPGAKPGLLLRGTNRVNGGLGNPVGDGLLCASGSTLRSQVQLTSGAGSTTFGDFKGQPFGATAVGAGAPTYYQFWYRDTANGCSGQGFNFTNAWETTWQP